MSPNLEPLVESESTLLRYALIAAIVAMLVVVTIHSLPR
jgi:hypothetical protein